MPLKGHNNLIASVAFSPDGQRIVTGGKDNTAKLWDATTGEELLTFKGHCDWIFSVAFSPDGKTIAYLKPLLIEKPYEGRHDVLFA